MKLCDLCGKEIEGLDQCSCPLQHGDQYHKLCCPCIRGNTSALYPGRLLNIEYLSENTRIMDGVYQVSLDYGVTWVDKSEMDTELVRRVEQTRLKYITSIFPIGALINDINEANGWNVTKPSDWEGNKYKIPAVLMLITSEVAEALEAYRKGDKENFAEECADVFIRLLDMTHGLEIDLAKAIADKLVKNVGRGYRHGGKVV